MPGRRANVSDALFSLNAAIGGDGGPTAAPAATASAAPCTTPSPAAYGPSLPGGTLTLSDSLVIGNLAQGGDAGRGGPPARASAAASTWPPAAPPR